MVAMQQTVSIIGAGPAGFALAADLHINGTSVLVYSHSSHLRHAREIQQKGHLAASGKVEGTMCLRITTKMSEAIEFSNILVLAVPSTGQETVLKEMKKFKLDQHIIIAIPGNLFSLLADIKAGCILETNLSPYSCRLDEEQLDVFGKKRLLFIAASKKQPSQAIQDEIRRIFPVDLKWSSNVIEVCLANVNGIFHPLMMLMNAGRIESTNGDFHLYRDGLTQSVANAMIAIDRVRMEIGATLGLPIGSAVEISNECYGHNFVDFVDLARNSGPHNNLKAPPDLNNRNLSEDVPDLLVCWYYLAEKLGIDASPIKAVITMVQMATGVDYLENGRDLEKLHLDHISRSELIKRFGTSSVTNGLLPTVTENGHADLAFMKI